MDNNFPTQSPTATRKARDVQKAELERRSRDLYTVYNPTNTDYQVILNAAVQPEVWTISAKDEAIVPNYVRIKYLEEMTNKIIISKSDKLVLDENEKRESKGFNRMNLHTEQANFERRNLKVLMGRREQIVKILDRGLYKEYGVSDNTNQALYGNSRDLEAGDVLDEMNNKPSRPTQDTPKSAPEPAKRAVEDEKLNTEPQNENKGFICDICGKSFEVQVALLGHKRSHKNTTEKTDYKVEEEDDGD